MLASPLPQPTAVLQRHSRVTYASSASPVKLYQWVDVAVGLVALLGVFMATNFYTVPSTIEGFFALRVTVKNVLLLGLFSLVWTSIFRFLGLYNLYGTKRRRDEAIRIIKACSLGSVFVLLFPIISVTGAFSFRAVLFFWFVATAAAVFARFFIRALTSGVALGRQARHQIIVGSGPRALDLYRALSRMPGTSYIFLGFVDSSNNHPVPAEVRRQTLGTLEQLEEILMTRVVDEVLIALPVKSCYHQIQSTIETCERVGVESKYLPDIFQFSLAKPRYEQTENFSVVTMKVAHDDYRLMIKRMIDVIGGLAGLIIFSPIMVLASIAIKLTSRGPIIFTQNRHGLNKRPFKMYKFRTMVVDAETLQKSLEHKNEVTGPVFKIKDDPRITELGKFLRKTSIDELPQLINVLRGDMSLVGPRPLPIRDVARFSEAWLMRRFSVKPGLTCLWQINGRSNTNFDLWVKLDLKYIDEWSLSLDLKILAKTLPVVLKGAGAA